MRKVPLTSSMLLAGLGAPAAAQPAGKDAAANGTTGIRHIIVTAQRKSESTQKAGIAITMLNARNDPAASPLNYITSAPRTFGVRAGVNF